MRTLIGRRRADGIFNFEGGCYAKCIKPSKEAEPEIYAASKRFGAVLENVVLDANTREPDFDDSSMTENTRSASARIHPQCLAQRPRRPSEESGDAGRRCVPRDAADCQTDAGAGDKSQAWRC